MKVLLTNVLLITVVFVCKFTKVVAQSCSSFCTGKSGLLNAGSCYWVDFSSVNWNGYYGYCKSVANAAGFTGTTVRLAIIDTPGKWTAIQGHFNPFVSS